VAGSLRFAAEKIMGIFGIHQVSLLFDADFTLRTQYAGVNIQLVDGRID
jgi:hypothetical protein